MKILLLLGIMAYVVQGNIEIKVIQKVCMSGDCDLEPEAVDNEETTTISSLKEANAALAKVGEEINQLKDSIAQAEKSANAVQSAGSTTSALVNSTRGSRRHRRETSSNVTLTSCDDPTATIQGSALNVTLQVIQGILDELANIVTTLNADKLNCYIALAQDLAQKFNEGIIPKLGNDIAQLQQLATQVSSAVNTSTASLAQKTSELKASLESKVAEQASLQQQIQSLGGSVVGITTPGDQKIEPQSTSNTTPEHSKYSPGTTQPGDLVNEQQSTSNTAPELSKYSPSELQPHFSTTEQGDKLTEQQSTSDTTPEINIYERCTSLESSELILRKCPFSSTVSAGTIPDRIFGENCWSSQKSNIASGTVTSLDEYPYSIAIIVQNSIYGGSVISSTWILTSAWNLHDDNGGLITDLYAQHRTNIDVSRYFIHPDYRICPTSRENNIALLELCEPIEQTFPALKPICFATVSENFAQTSVMTTAWSSTAKQEFILKEATLNIISQDECENLLKNKVISTPRNKETYFCTYTATNDTCLYDNGGAVVAEVLPGDWIQLGVTSIGYRCKNADIPRVHMKVTAFKDWIVNTTKLPPVFKSEKYQTCPVGDDSSTTTSLEDTTNQTSSRCPVKTLFGEKCWSGDAANLRIVGGRNATLEYPYQIAIYLNKEFSCGGSIISSSWILTAAHCVVNNRGSWMGDQLVHYGSVYLAKGKTAHVKRIIVHQDYISRGYPLSYSKNDIALMELCQPLDFSTPEVQPICFASEPTQDEGTVVATGWGRLEQGGTLPEYLQEVNLTLVSTKEGCKGMIPLEGTTSSDNSSFLCAFDVGKDTCQGDSGGPIVTRLSTGCWVQLGITSYGKGCADDKPGVYTRVSAFKDWICEHTKLC